MAGDVLVVDERDDGMSVAFERAATAVGARVRRCRLPEASRLMTISVDGDRIAVDPGCALLLRPFRPPLGPADAEERFVRGELMATLWAAAAATDAPVVNRPNEYGLASTVALSAVVTDRRVGRGSSPPESFWRGWAPGDDGWRHQDLTTWEVIDDPSTAPLGRSRNLPPMRGWEQVVVVGDRGERVTTADIGPTDIVEDSIAVARMLDLTFVTVSWGVPADGSPPVLTRVNAFPTLNECLPVLDATCAALVGLLCR